MRLLQAQWGQRGAVAVKKLLLKGTGGRVLREIKEELTSEAQQLNKVASPHVIELKGVVFQDPNFAIVMEFAAPDLAFFLTDVEPSALSWGQRFRIAKEIALGLAAVHRANVRRNDFVFCSTSIDERWCITICGLPTCFLDHSPVFAVSLTLGCPKPRPPVRAIARQRQATLCGSRPNIRRIPAAS